MAVPVGNQPHQQRHEQQVERIDLGDDALRPDAVGKPAGGSRSARDTLAQSKAPERLKRKHDGQRGADRTEHVDSPGDIPDRERVAPQAGKNRPERIPRGVRHAEEVRGGDQFAAVLARHGRRHRP